MAAFNSPVWFNVGFEEQPQCSACFILSVEDTMDSILDWNTQARAGSSAAAPGSGINLSNIRGSMEPLSKGGTASGPVSFMRGADSWAGTIKSGGKTRRAAKMVVLDVDHPDIREFIWCKAKEEDKAEALRDAGFDMSIDGDGFTSIQYQNANNSVRVTDEFMHAVEDDGEWRTIARTTGEPIGEPMHARELMREIAEAAWRCADPGVQYDTTINQWHTSPELGAHQRVEPVLGVHARRRLGLQPRVAEPHEVPPRPTARSTSTPFEHAVDIVFLAQEIVVGPSSYPTEEIGVNARAFRQLGLGYANLGAYLMANGMPYDSDAGRGTAAAITALMTGRAYLQSAQGRRGDRPVRALRGEPRARTTTSCACTATRRYAIPDATCRDDALLAAARAVVGRGRRRSASAHGYRNAQATVLAPTGTISFLMDCDTTGIEPDFSLVKFKELVGGGTMTIVNRTVPLALQTLGYADEQIEQIVAHIDEHGTIVGAPGPRATSTCPVFDVAVGERAISHMGHIKMMGAVQPFISGAISKTVNMPHDGDRRGHRRRLHRRPGGCGVKALAIYRDGSKTAQALRTDAQKARTRPQRRRRPRASRRSRSTRPSRPRSPQQGGAVGPRRKRMPRERQSLTHKFSIGGHEGYITAGMYEDGTVGEIFITDVGKEGSTLRGMMNSFATAISIALQYGVPLETLVQKFAYMRFEPEGITQNPEIPFAKSMPDYIMRWLASRFLDADIQEELGILTPEVRAQEGGRGGGDVVSLGHRRPAPAPRATPPTAARPAERAASRRRPALTDTPAGRPGPPGRPGPRPGLHPVRRHDAAHGLVLHVLELRQQHRLRLMRTACVSMHAMSMVARKGPCTGPFRVASRHTPHLGVVGRSPRGHPRSNSELQTVRDLGALAVFSSPRLRSSGQRKPWHSTEVGRLSLMPQLRTVGSRGAARTDRDGRRWAARPS